LNQLIITGIRGVPASHGGFETFAENLAIYLVSKGWQVAVYCQEAFTDSMNIYETNWQGVQRIHIPVRGDGAKATIVFDYLSVKDALKRPGLVLTLGYNTALFNFWFRIKGKKNLINMDGIEWKRNKWKWYEKAWLYLNERAGCLIGNHLIADHPEIKKHLITRVDESKVTMIPYGARQVCSADVSLLSTYSLQPKSYALVIARPEPENSILEIVKAFSKKQRHHSLVVLGRYDKTNSYHAQVLESVSDEVKFIGAVYDHATLDALRFNASLYVHGHTVGGTNPSLIEALGAGQPVLAHDNQFNRWVAGTGAFYFDNTVACADAFDSLLDNEKLSQMSQSASERFAESFTWHAVLKQYEDLLLKWV
jgi:glycosyltransferase involved in cell wall biosynthesis